MPLVVLCGIPCSGKTRRCRELVNYLEQHYPDQTIHLVGDEEDNKSKHYVSSREEKTQRASLKSRVERLLTRESLVILDSLNYIKGYRYELYCLSKHLLTPHCVVFCDTPLETAKEWNCGGESLQSYSPELLDELGMRFEPPDSRNRWDYPLFVLYPDDPLPSENICDALFHRKPPPPNQSTQSQPLSESSFLHELDRMTQEVVRVAMDAQRSNATGWCVTVSGSQEKLVLPRHVTMAELRQLRKQFIAYSKQHPVDSSCSNITTLFVQYINKTLI